MAFVASKDILDGIKSGLNYSAQAESDSDIFKAAIQNLEAAGLNDVIYTPARQHNNYGARIDSYWSLTPRLHPWAIVQPRNTSEVSKAVAALVQTGGCQFAVRSGGHTSIPGSNNITNGITLDLGLMDKTKYNPGTKLASIEPGGRWTNVYAYLEERGVMVAGGREGLVGVGGLLTGGGKTYYTCRVGFACDQVVNYEIVLADGTITTANENVNSDLFETLKGGSNNFGIVTRFDMKTFPAQRSNDSHIIALWASMPRRDIALLSGIIPDPTQPPDLTMVSTINMVMIQLDGVENSSSLKRFMDIPNRLNNTMKHTTIAKKVAGLLLPSNREDIWLTLTFKLDKRILEKTTEIYRKLVEDINNRLPGSVIQMALQPFPTMFVQNSTARGGNMMGLEQVRSDSVLAVVAVEGNTPGFHDTAFPILSVAVQELEDFAKQVNGHVGFRYLNYADGSQDPLASYGADNIRKMKAAAAKYDPNGVFQKRVPGGFKISKVT
ncbi:hypothetical protein G7054_g1500 [Neopestalotiopsis clavispora]|nr:hypothetical protein G7054_g1500 [Neopestalotiopsis clavispora]